MLQPAKRQFNRFSGLPLVFPQACQEKNNQFGQANSKSVWFASAQVNSGHIQNQVSLFRHESDKVLGHPGKLSR